MASEVRKFVRTQIDELIDSREPQVLAGIVSDFRVINGQRGKLGLFKIDDKSGMIEASADEALLNTYRNQLKEDEFVVVVGPPADGSFQRWLAGQGATGVGLGRCALPLRQVSAHCHGDMQPDVKRLVSEFPPRREETEEGEILHGLRVRMGVRCQSDQGGAVAELQLGEGAGFSRRTPRWRPGARRRGGSATVVYE